MTSHPPDQQLQWWLRDDVAAYLDVSPNTVSGYVSHRRPLADPIPEPSYVGRTPRWRPGVIVEWAARRPGRGRWRSVR